MRAGERVGQELLLEGGGGGGASCYKENLRGLDGVFFFILGKIR